MAGVLGNCEVSLSLLLRN